MSYFFEERDKLLLQASCLTVVNTSFVKLEVAYLKIDSAKHKFH